MCPVYQDIYISDIHMPTHTKEEESILHMSIYKTSSINLPITLVSGDGVSIPCCYTSYLCPVSSAKLHALVSTAIDKEKVK